MDEKIEQLLAFAELYFETHYALGRHWWTGLQ